MAVSGSGGISISGEVKMIFFVSVERGGDTGDRRNFINLFRRSSVFSFI